MCWAKKCCFCVNVNVGALLFAIGSFMFSLMLCVSSGVFLIIENKEIKALMVSHNTTHPEQTIFGVQLKVINVNVILVATLITSLLTTLFSILLIIGIIKNRPSLLLCYFFFGIMTTILMQLGCLLLMLQGCWYISLVWFFGTLAYFHYLIVVYTLYESMQRGKQFSFKVDDMDEELLS